MPQISPTASSIADDDDYVDEELQALLRQNLGSHNIPSEPITTGVLESAEFVTDNAIDLSISASHTRAAAETVHRLMQEKGYSTETWSSHELHPKAKDESTINFIFTMDLLNFSFWSDSTEGHYFAVEYKGRNWTGYWSLVAALQRALDEGYPITTPTFWRPSTFDATFHHIFRSCTSEPMPLLSRRISLLREACLILEEESCDPLSLILSAKQSAVLLVNLLTSLFSNCFSDAAVFHSRKVYFHKRAQILVADLWAAFNGTSYGTFHDIDQLTMFADYRVPQTLHGLHCLRYSPRLESMLKKGTMLEAGSDLEVEIRGVSIWCVEMLRREIERRHPDTKRKLNAVLIDFFLYDLGKENEKSGQEILPHHRTRSIWY